MSFRSSLLIAGIMGNRWRATSAPSSGTTCVAQVSAPNSSGSRLNVESIWYSIKNETAANATVSVQVRDATTTGSVMARVEHVLLPASGFNGFFPNMAVVGNRGSGLAIMMDTVISSVSQSINATGWTEDSPSLPIDLTPSFSLLFKDLGAGAVDTSEQFGRYAPTFTRATAAWTRLSTGLWASVSSGVARSYYDINGVYRGYLSEGLATVGGSNPRDLTNAAWNTKTNVTAAKDQTGIDGVANSASSVVATAGNGVITQAQTITSRAQTFQAFVKRITGTGTILISLDGFATTTDITALISSSAWTDLGVVFKTQTLANPAFGFKIVTSGDKIAVDMAEIIEGSATHTPANGTTVNGDVLTYAFAASSTAGSFVTNWTQLVSAGNTLIIATADDGSANNFIRPIYISTGNNGAMSSTVVTATVNQGFTPGAPSGSTIGTPHKSFYAYTTNDVAFCIDGGSISTDSTVTLPAGLTTVRIGTAENVTTGQPSSGISGVKYFPVRLPNALGQSLST